MELNFESLQNGMKCEYGKEIREASKLKSDCLMCFHLESESVKQQKGVHLGSKTTLLTQRAAAEQVPKIISDYTHTHMHTHTHTHTHMHTHTPCTLS